MAPAMAAADVVGGGPVSTFVTASVAQAQGKEEWGHSWCRQCVVPPCGIKVRVKDGVAVLVEGHPNCLANMGRLRSSGNAAIVTLYNPCRVKVPQGDQPQQGPRQGPRLERDHMGRGADDH